MSSQSEKISEEEQKRLLELEIQAKEAEADAATQTYLSHQAKIDADEAERKKYSAMRRMEHEQNNKSWARLWWERWEKRQSGQMPGVKALGIGLSVLSYGGLIFWLNSTQPTFEPLIALLIGIFVVEEVAANKSIRNGLITLVGCLIIALASNSIGAEATIAPVLIWLALWWLD